MNEKEIEDRKEDRLDLGLRNFLVYINNGNSERSV